MFIYLLCALVCLVCLRVDDYELIKCILSTTASQESNDGTVWDKATKSSLKREKKRNTSSQIFTLYGLSAKEKEAVDQQISCILYNVT